MKQYILPIIISVLFLASCSGGDDGISCDPVADTAPEAEVTALQQYLTANSIAATPDARGFFYIISKPGSGDKPTVCSEIKVNYTGRLTNNEPPFDQANGAIFNLGGLIKGWQEGIPLIAKGGAITLYLPPSLAYGANAQSGIPANSILIFNIDLVEIY